MARSGFDWWVGELESLLPAGLIRRSNLTAWHRYDHGAVIAASRAGVDTLVIPRELCLVRTLTLPDVFQDHDKPDVMYAEAGLDADGIVRGALAALGIDNASVAGRRA